MSRRVRLDGPEVQEAINAARAATVQVCGAWLRDEADRLEAQGLDGYETCRWLADRVERGVRRMLVESTLGATDGR